MKALLICGLLTLVTLGATQWMSQDPNKRTGSSNRIAMWMNTAHLIAAHPLGVGIGGFEHNYVPYQRSYAPDLESREMKTVSNPHNSFLHLAADAGLPMLLAFLFFLGVLYRQLRKAPAERARLPHRLAVLLLTYFSVSACFGFPHINPFSFFFMAVALALILLCLGRVEALRKERSLLFIVAAATLSFTLAYRVFTSDRLGHHFGDDYDATTRSCELNPQNWRGCLAKARIEFLAGYYDIAIGSLDEIFRYYPNHFAATVVLGDLYSTQKNIPQACAAYKKYDDYYAGQTSVHGYLEQNCPPTAD